MSDAVYRRHGLESLLRSQPDNASGARLEVCLLPVPGQIGLRGNSADPTFLSLAESTLGQTLPRRCNTISFGNYRIYWLGPDEWFILAPVPETKGLAARLRSCLEHQHASVIELGGANITLSLSGVAARDLLARGSCVNFAPDRFLPGHCAQTALAKTGAIIGLIDTQPTFEIIVRRSFSDYLVRWLNSAGRAERIEFTTAQQSA